MGDVRVYTEMGRLRCFAAAFTRSVFNDILTYGNFDKINLYRAQYTPYWRKNKTYLSLFQASYQELLNGYRCEYVYKNELINKYLIKEFGTANTVAHSEFKLGRNIVDLALFNGESKAFEVKSPYDTPARLASQLETYTKFFDKCYVLISESDIRKYESIIPSNVGILFFVDIDDSCEIKEHRKAERNESLDIDLLMSVLRCSEYQQVVREYYIDSDIPEMSSFTMFDICKELIGGIPTDKLKRMVLDVMKTRRNCTSDLDLVPDFLREIYLKLNLPPKKGKILLKRLEQPLS